MLRAEVRLLETAAGVDPGGGLVATSEAIEVAIDARPALGTDQAAAVRHLCSGEERVRVLEARAGTGKTFALEAVREAYEASHVPVIGVAWQGQAADVLQRDAGIPSQTAALLLDRIARGDEEAIPVGAVIVCDEASMMPTRALERLAAEAAQRCARLILVGDRAQLPAIDAAGGFAALADRLGAVELTENRRQRTDLQRQVADRLATGNPGDALALLAEHGRLHGFDDAREARAALIAAWAETSLSDPSTGLILAHDRHEVATLNQMARATLDRAGLLGPSRIVASGREWAAGDRLVCRRNNYRLGVRNGTRGTVVEVDTAQRALVVRTDEGVVLPLPEGYLNDVHHGYALTGHISQGTTVERTYLLATPERGGREWAYVAASRQRVDLMLFAVHHDLERLESALARAWGRSDAKRLALDLVDPAHRSRAVVAADADLDGRLPERISARANDLRIRREDARSLAAGRTRGVEQPVHAREDAQRITAELRAMEASLSRWSAQAQIARPSPRILAVFGSRPSEPTARRSWDRAVGSVTSYRNRHPLAVDEPTLLGLASTGGGRHEWEAAAGTGAEALQVLGRLDFIDGLVADGRAERVRAR
ncbi:MAG: AAA family ATPase [Thermoleophilia bacterium]